jgi:lysophospholipase L1-like esterase
MTPIPRRLHSIRLVFASCLFAVLLVAGCQTAPPNSLATHDSSRWQKDMATFQAIDLTNRPPAGCIVFVGSSSIRLWKTLAQDFPGHPVVNRGFGGSQIADSVAYAEELITRHKPCQVIIYAGGNDLNAGKAPALVYGDFVALVKKIRAGAPNAKIGYISSAPNPARWAQVERVRELNSRIQTYCRRHGCTFINVFPLMLGDDGFPKPDIFVADRLHMNENGYAIWREAVRPHLK